MNSPDECKLIKGRPGGWLPQDYTHIDRWISRLQKYVSDQPRELAPPIAEFQNMVRSDDVLQAQIEAMFSESDKHKKITPLGQLQVRTFEQFLQLLNGIMTTAPEAYQDIPSHEPAGLIGFPINALLDWPMATESGYDVFANALVNQQFKRGVAIFAKACFEDFLSKQAAKT